MDSTQIMFLAGEASGDTLAAELVQALRALPEVTALEVPPRLFGAGGPRLREAGVELALDLTAHAVVGLWEAVRHYPTFKRLFDQLLRLACERLPDVIVLVDNPGFNLRFARAVKRLVRRRQGPFFNWSPRIVQYVSPQVWAWHESRVYQIARDVDLLLSIFPFEQPWYAVRVPELTVEYVGHPMVDRFAAAAAGGRVAAAEPALLGGRASPRSDRPTGVQPQAPAAANTPSDAPLVVLLPGSRERELSRHLGPVLGAARLIRAQRPAVFRLVLPNERLATLARQAAGSLPDLEVAAGGLAEALAGATIAIAASGTVTMECAFFGVPSVVLYRTAWSNYVVGKHLGLVRVNYLAMPNLLAGEAVSPEFIQHEATAENLARAALDLLGDAARRARVKAKLAKVVADLGPPGASARAAAAVWRLVAGSGGAASATTATSPLVQRTGAGF
jgi:lipid-A-disaccharide synthase